MADVPKFPGFPGQPGERWAFIKNIPSFLGGEDAEVDTSILPFDLGDKRLIESNEPFMPPDLTAVERDWQNVQKIPEGTRDIFNRIVNEGAPASSWPVQELFPHIEPRSSNPIRSPYPTPTTTPTERTMIRALQPVMRGPSGPPPTRIPSFRPFLRGGPLALGVASSLFSPRAEAPMKTPRRVYEDVTNPLHMSPVYFTDEDSPFRKQLPHSLFPPGYLRERAGRNAVEGVRQNLLGNLGLLPSTTSGALTPQELFKQRNDAEELRIREGRLPVIPEVPEWNPQASIPPDFRVNERSMAALSPSVTYTPPPVVPSISREQEIENMMMQERIGQLEYLPGGSLYEAPFEQGTGPMASQVSQALADAAYGRPVQEELQAITQLGATNPILIDRYTTPGSEELQDIESQVDSFAAMSNVGNRFGEVPWTPQAPVIPDIVVPPPAVAPTPYVEQFEELTPPRKVEQRQPSQRAPKVVKKKATKAKPKPRRVKQTAVQKALAKPAPRRVKYTPPKPKSKTPVTRRKGGKPKVRRVSKAPRRPGGR